MWSRLRAKYIREYVQLVKPGSREIQSPTFYIGKSSWMYFDALTFLPIPNITKETKLRPVNADLKPTELRPVTAVTVGADHEPMELRSVTPSLDPSEEDLLLKSVMDLIPMEVYENHQSEPFVEMSFDFPPVEASFNWPPVEVSSGFPPFEMRFDWPSIEVYEQENFVWPNDNDLLYLRSLETDSSLNN